MAARLELLLFAALMCAACQVGQPLVDELADGQAAYGVVPCRLPPRCEPPPMPDGPSHPAAIFSLDPCTNLCQLGASAASGRCPEVKLEALPAMSSCAFIPLQLDSSASEILVENVEWRDLNLSLRAERPVTVRVSGGWLLRVFVELSGPITLRFEHLESSMDLRIASGPDPAGQRVEIDGAQRAAGLSVGSEAQRFEGELRLRALEVADIDARAERMTFESVFVSQASLRADSLMFTDVKLDHVWIETNHALWSGFTAQDLWAQFCGDARLIGGDALRAALRTCPESILGMYDTDLGTGVLDGELELDHVTFQGVRFGVSEATRTSIYGSELSSVSFCDNTERLALGVATKIGCSDCSQALRGHVPACELDSAQPELLANLCPDWREPTRLAACPDEVPVRPHRVH